MTDEQAFPSDQPLGDDTPEQPEGTEDLLAAAKAAIESVESPAEAAEAAPPPADAGAFDLPSLDPGELADAPKGIDLLDDVNLNVQIELGRTVMYVEDVLRLCNGAVVELDKLAGDPVDIYVNERLVARGEVLVLNDSFCVRVSEIIETPNADKKTA